MQSSKGTDERLETPQECCILVRKGDEVELGTPELSIEKKEDDEQAAIAG